MRIALVSTPFVAVPPRGYGGTELVVHELQRGLALAGHDVTLFATGDSEGPDVRFVADRAAWPPDEGLEAEHALFAAREIAGGDFDLVHAHVPSFVPYAAALPLPVVYTLHHAADARLAALYARHPEVTYVAISRRQAQLLQVGDGPVVHHGLDPERHPAGRGEGGYAMFIGRLAWCKAPDVAIGAARSAGCELVVAGSLHAEPEDPSDWPGRIDALIRSPGVRHIGVIGGELKCRLLGGARALLMPLRWEEPFGLVMIEAMLCGTPVIAFRRGSAPEVVDDGVTGYLVDDEAEMADALRRVQLIDRAACRAHARTRFSAMRMVREHLRVYHHALAEAGRWRSAATEDTSYATT